MSQRAQAEPSHQVFSTKLDSEFQSFYRAHFNYKPVQQLKLEQQECIRVHCYPMAEPRYAKFNHERADLCVKECNRAMETLMSHQVSALAEIKTVLSGPKVHKSKKEEVFRGAVAKLDAAALSLTQPNSH